MNRRKQILGGISKEMRGIEVAPYFAPLTSKRDGYDCRALDVFDTAELVARATDDPNIPKEKIPLIEAVDFVGSATEIANLIPASVPSLTEDSHVAANQSECGHATRGHLLVREPGEPVAA